MQHMAGNTRCIYHISHFGVMILYVLEVFIPKLHPSAFWNRNVSYTKAEEAALANTDTSFLHDSSRLLAPTVNLQLLNGRYKLMVTFQMSKAHTHKWLHQQIDHPPLWSILVCWCGWTQLCNITPGAQQSRLQRFNWVIISLFPHKMVIKGFRE